MSFRPSDSTLLYLISATLAAFLVACVLQPWTYAHDYVFTSGNDWLWQQAVVQMHADGGPWGATGHLSWPIGANAWRLPQFGLGVGFFAWVTVGWFGVGTAAATLWFLVVAAALDAAAMVYLLRRVGGRHSGPFLVATAVSASASVFLVTHHLNNAFFACLPIVFGVLVAASGRAADAPARPSRRELALVAVVGLFAPLWWIVVLLLAVPFVALPFVVRRRWWQAQAVGLVWTAVAAVGGVQVGLHLLAASGGPGTDDARQPWLGNALSGHVTDLLVGSPILRRLAPGMNVRLAEGASVDTAYGLPFLIGAGVAVAMVLTHPPRRLRDGTDLTVLGSLTVVFVLFWLGGGLGNLQAAIAVVFGATSPARGWYRMIVPLAVLGAAWIVALANGRLERFGRVAGACLLVVVVADLALIGNRWLTWTPSDAPQRDRAAIAFLRDSTDPCPVAQLPHEGLPTSAIRTGIASNRLYRGMVPYVLAPEYLWSAGSFDPLAPDGRDLVTDVPPEATDADLDVLAARGFCAVIYDRLLGELAVQQQAPVAGRSLAASRPADFRDDRYVVYLLG